MHEWFTLNTIESAQSISNYNNYISIIIVQSYISLQLFMLLQVRNA